eukprot:1160373-Pelagomonas_calceolata.AAC.1
MYASKLVTTRRAIESKDAYRSQLRGGGDRGTGRTGSIERQPRLLYLLPRPVILAIPVWNSDISIL